MARLEINQTIGRSGAADRPEAAAGAAAAARDGMKLDLQAWIEPGTFAFGWRALSGRWVVIHFGPLCLEIGRQ